MRRDLRRTKEVISKVVKRFGPAVENSVMSKEDLSQELWLKTLELERRYVDKPDNEYFKILIASLNNHARKLIRYYSSRPDTSWFSSYENLNYDNENGNFVDNTILKDDKDYYKDVEIRISLEKIKEVLKSTNLKYKHFIDEYLEFARSEEWKRIQEEHPVYRAELYPSLTTFFKVKYGISGKRANDIVKRVRQLVA